MNREEKQLPAKKLLEILMQMYPKERAIELFEELMVDKEDVPVYNPYTDTFVSFKLTVGRKPLPPEKLLEILMQICSKDRAIELFEKLMKDCERQ